MSSLDSLPDPQPGRPQAPRQCRCSGSCVPHPSESLIPSLSRRDFLGLTGAATAAILHRSPWDLQASPPHDLVTWKKALPLAGERRVYRSLLHTDARLHLGGIGTGNLELGVDGQLTNWQLFNTLHDSQVPLHFLLHAPSCGLKLLQTTGGPDAPRVPAIEMHGEYPIATLHYRDPKLPVRLSLEAFTPFAPLDSDLSSVPLAAFIFRLENPSTEPQKVLLAALMLNPVGYDALGTISGVRHPNFGGNLNRPFRAGRNTRGFVLAAQPAPTPKLDRPLQLWVGANLATLRNPPPDRPENLAVQTIDRLPATAPASADKAREALIWFEDLALDTPVALLRQVRDHVRAGATLVLAGKTQPLLAAYARLSQGRPLEQIQGRPDILFEDFEQGYAKWRLDGNCFGERPPTGTLPQQQAVSGFLGRGLVNTFRGGDATTGHATSEPFHIERRYIRFLLGGGSHPNTQIRLLVGGNTVRSASGRDHEALLPVTWDVGEFDGQEGRLQIVDENTGAWGHTNVDQIEFSDRPANHDVFLVLQDLLPARFTDVRAQATATPGNPNPIEFGRLEPLDGAQPQTAENGLRLLVRSVGQGRVALASGPVLDPGQAGLIGCRQTAYALVCTVAGARYERTPRTGVPANAPGFGSLGLAVTADETLAIPASSSAEAALRAVREGKLERFDQAFPENNQTDATPTDTGESAYATVAAQVTVRAGGSVEVPFLLTWHYPNKYSHAGPIMGCHYTTRWPDAQAVLQDAAQNLAAWRTQTRQFHQALYATTLPYWLLDALTANAAIARHIGVVFRIANGDVYGWEGSNGCCQPTCTHVWGYEQTLARLFPDLERDMRRIDFKHQQRADGGVHNRTDVPSPPRPTGEQPFADGHASCILKAYREALNSPDESFFAEYWPHARRAVEYLIGRDAASHNGQPAGYLDDDQWNTYDEALHGVTTFIGTYYLAALRAGEAWAHRMNDPATADRFHSVFELGQKKLVELCWNGEYFHQHLPDYLTRPGEVGPGCMSDQLIGQWWAHQLGLGYLLPKDQVVSALKAVFRYNWKEDLTGWKHAPRAFAGDGDRGLIICTWPKGGRPPHVMLYSDEVWTGIEYQVAAHMIYEGLTEEGLAVARAARDRYDGVPRAPIPRNPWNEIECGGHYARAMSSWSLLLALSGFQYDGPRAEIRFGPRLTPDTFNTLFTAAEAWGAFQQRTSNGHLHAQLAVHAGQLRLRQLTLAKPPGIVAQRAQISLGGQPLAVEFTPGDTEIRCRWPQDVVVPSGSALQIEFL